MLETEYSTDEMIMQDAEGTTSSSSPLSDWLYSLLFIILTTIAFLLFCPELRHWFILPLVPCGIIIGTDAVKWFRGKYDIFDPKAIIGLAGVHFFYLSPILVALWKVRISLTATPLEDYRPWLGVMGVANFFGLILYQVTQRWFARRPYVRPIKVWQPNPSRIVVVLSIFIFIALAAQGYSFAKQGIVIAKKWTETDFEATWGGMGMFRMFSKSLPILLLILFTLLKGRLTWRRSNIVVVAFFVILLTSFAFVFGGLAGSRSATVWILFWVVGIIHYYWRPLSRKMVVIGLILLVMFMYFYGFFKHIGADAWQIYQREGLKGLTAESGQTFRGMLIGDLSRADVQAYMAYVLIDKPYHYRYRYGETVIGDFLVQFPRWILLTKYNTFGDSGKMIAGTDIMMGPGFYNPFDIWRKSRYVYGLAGSAMLNFGVLSIPLAFIFWGAIVGWYRRRYLSWSLGDIRFFLAPAVVNLLRILLSGDLDNALSYIIFTLAIPITVIWLISYRFYPDPISQTYDLLPDTEYATSSEYSYTSST